jgi:uncharacterized protein (TIGR00730 family)
MKRICVFCGSRAGSRPEFAQAAADTGRAIAAAGAGLVFGGGSVGLMRIVADAALDAGAEVIGVIPGFLIEKEHVHPGLRDLRVVDTMHERKALMASLADAFIALPGGFGTIEEIFEMLTWSQLGLHAKPCGFLNVADYYTPLIAFLDQAVAAEFLAGENRRATRIETDAVQMVRHMLAAIGPGT